MFMIRPITLQDKWGLEVQWGLSWRSRSIDILFGHHRAKNGPEKGVMLDFGIYAVIRDSVRCEIL